MLCFSAVASFSFIRLFFTAASVILLSYRFYYYLLRHWLLYFFDLCFYVHFAILGTLWLGALGKEGEPSEWNIAVFSSVTGPVGGAAFMLQTALTLHHPEAFESWFLHVVPMWVVYAIRWRWGIFTVTQVVPISEVVWLGFSKIYLPWALCYTSFLMLKPYIPPVAKLPTLFDWYVYGDVKEIPAPTSFLTWAWKPVVYILLHALLSLEGYAAAALCFQYETMNLIWIGMVLLGNIKCGYYFYRQSWDKDYKVGNKIVEGLRDSALAWCVLIPSYLHCSGYWNVHNA